MAAFKDLLRYWRTVRHLKPSQVAWRARRRLEQNLKFVRCHPSVETPPHFDPDTAAALRAFACDCERRHAPEPSELEALRENRFSFLGVTVENPLPICWTRDGVSRLWLFNLHYFDYARTLALANVHALDEADRDRVLRWTDDWIERNPVGRGIGWDAFVIAARLINWAIAFSVFGAAGDRIRQSIAEQTAYLIRHLEHDVRANHLLKEAQALVVTGRMLGSGCAVGRQALAVGLPLFERELDEQVLPDGGHYERSLMYHCHVLEDCLAAYAALDTKPRFLKEHIARMADFLAQTLHADEDIPLFGDAVLNTRMPPRALIALARDLCEIPQPESQPGCRALEPSGFYVMTPRDARARLIVKAGPPGPSYQLGHSHCDMLSYELTAGAQRLIVDSGVRDYEQDRWRAYCRSTRAHNTVIVNGQEQLECWDVFRVGRRYRATVHSWGPHRDGWRLDASHDGFKPSRHERAVFLCHDRFWVFIDRLTGPGACEAESFIHFHPDVEVEKDGDVWRARRGDAAVIVAPFAVETVDMVRGAVDPLQGWYCSEFGKAVAAGCLVLRSQGAFPLVFGYGIFTDPRDVLTGEELVRFADNLIR